ncbi:hypothetical protein [uncultured Nitratireductor sp.]|uniref:hypothetical protein n=1 Tax=uncultured Nitratireductor sp. TaxID=520953 RepID=UPI002607F175|nr:hypothetical protein [uncultured Nitratireductor sp.]
MTSKAYAVKPHVRRAPVDPYAEVREATTRKLQRFVEEQKVNRECEKALEEALCPKGGA